MIMEPRLGMFSGTMNRMQFVNQPLSVLPNQNLVAEPRFENTFMDHSYREHNYLAPNAVVPGRVAPVSNLSHEDDSHEDCDFSDAVLRYINTMLMEEDMEDKTCMLQDSLDLQAAERSLYEAIGKRYPPSPEPNSTCIMHNGVNPDESAYWNYRNCSIDGYFVGNGRVQSLPEYDTSPLQTLPISSISWSSHGSSNSAITSVDGLLDSPGSAIQAPDLNSESPSISQFKRGVEEASKFLPSDEQLLVNLNGGGLLPKEIRRRTSEVVVKVEKEGKKEGLPNGLCGRKTSDREGVDLDEERNSKQAAIFPESILRSDLFDKVLLRTPGNGLDEFNALRDTLRDGAAKKVPQNGQSKGSNVTKGRGKRKGGKKEVVDLRNLLIQCAQDVAADDRRSANELLKQIRQHSSPFGDGSQRLSHCFANAFEARLAGTGSQIYKGLVSKRTPASDLLKAYHLYLAACPFRKISSFVSNKTIRNLAASSMKVHIIDFGILYGFQWPTMIQRFTWRDGGPPKLRITGIDFPQPGFRPGERVEETGRRLRAYAEEFKVPFDYNPIAKRWDAIQLEELKIDRDEVLVVNCIYRSKNLLDETMAVDSSRTNFLKLVRKINPDLFIHGIVNGGYNAPFFVTRFREALFHFSAMFDMLETIIPRENHERMLLEKEIFGREALNVIACEGWERVERPETYKQWQVRNLRAGFVQLPFDEDIVKHATAKVRSGYHKDFLIDEDGRWLLQGWKGRIIYALSAWKPA